MTAAPAAVVPRFWDTLSPAEATREAVGRLVSIPLIASTRRYFRALRLTYLIAPPSGVAEPLYYAKSAEGRRWTPVGGPRGLYMAEDPETATAELQLIRQQPDGTVVDVDAPAHLVTLTMTAAIARVLDVTSATTAAMLALTAADLHTDWEAEQTAAITVGARPPITQLLALAAHATGIITAIRYPSARRVGGVNLVVFPDRLDADLGETVRTADVGGLYPQALPPPTVRAFA